MNSYPCGCSDTETCQGCQKLLDKMDEVLEQRLGPHDISACPGSVCAIHTKPIPIPKNEYADHEAARYEDDMTRSWDAY